MLKILKDEKGAVLPLVALFLFFVGFGVIALVIDVGMLYNVRKEMITAADAGALAGAQELEKTLGTTINQADKDDAIYAAEQLALLNGAEVIDAKIAQMVVDLKDGSDLRNVIIVSAKKEVNFIFARFLGQDNSFVTAEAIATWGYTRKITGGQLLPVFMLNESYEAGKDILHDGKLILENGEVSPPNSGYVNFGDGNSQNIINQAFAGNHTTYTLNEVVYSITGVGQSLISNIEYRMDHASTLEPEAAKQYMTGIIPIVTSEAADIVDDSGNNKDKLKPHLELKILKFAGYTIRDVIKTSGNTMPKSGTTHALNDDHTGRVTSVYQYNNPYEKGTIIGNFTGLEIELYVDIQPGDQIGVPADDKFSIPYSKLIK